MDSDIPRGDEIAVRSTRPEPDPATTVEDGWLITKISGRWRATRQAPLTTWQIAYGCNVMLYAGTRGELDLYLTAERIKDGMIDLASRLIDGMAEAADKRRADITGP